MMPPTVATLPAPSSCCRWCCVLSGWFESLPSPPFGRGRCLGRSRVALPAAMIRESEIKFAGLTMVEVAKRFADWRRSNPDAIIIDREVIKPLLQLPQGGMALVRNAFSLTVKYRVWPRSRGRPK